MANNFAEKTAQALEELGASLKSVFKIATTKRGTVKPLTNRGRSDKSRKALIVLGNGPSLRQNIENDLEILQSNDTLAVNFASFFHQSFRPERRATYRKSEQDRLADDAFRAFIGPNEHRTHQ